MLYITADTHFDQDRISEFNGGIPRGEWEPLVVDAINRQVARSDRLIIVGDFAFEKPGFWRTQIRCGHVMLIKGNHDPMPKTQNVFGGNFRYEYVGKVNSTKTYFKHCPTAFWDGSHKGWFHCYGHIHDDQRREAQLDLLGDRRSMDVSLYSAKRRLGEWRPFRETEIYDILSVRKGHDPL